MKVEPTAGEGFRVESTPTVTGFTEPPRGRCSAHGEQVEVRVWGLSESAVVLGCSECVAEILRGLVDDFRKATGRTWEVPHE